MATMAPKTLPDFLAELDRMAVCIFLEDPANGDAIARVVFAALRAHRAGAREALLAGARAIEGAAEVAPFPLAKSRRDRAQRLADSVVGLRDPIEIADAFFRTNWRVDVRVISHADAYAAVTQDDDGGREHRAKIRALGNPELAEHFVDAWERGRATFAKGAAPVLRMVKGRALSPVNAETLVKDVAHAFGVKRPAELFRRRESKSRKAAAKP